VHQRQVDRRPAQAEFAELVERRIRVSLVEDLPAAESQRVHEVHGRLPLAAVPGAVGRQRKSGHGAGRLFSDGQVEDNDPRRKFRPVRGPSAQILHGVRGCRQDNLRKGFQVVRGQARIEVVGVIVGDQHQVHRVEGRRARLHFLVHGRVGRPVFGGRRSEEGVDEDLVRAGGQQHARIGDMGECQRLSAVPGLAGSTCCPGHLLAIPGLHQHGHHGQADDRQRGSIHLFPPTHRAPTGVCDSSPAARPHADGAASLPVGCDWKQSAAHGRQDAHPGRERLEVVDLETGNRRGAVTRRRDRSYENHGSGRMQVPHQGERRAARRR